MPEETPFLALLGENYGRDIDYLHFHNYLEIGYCYDGTGTLVLGDKAYRFSGQQFSIIPQNYLHTTNSEPGTVSKWEYLFIDVDAILNQFYQGGVSSGKATFPIGSIARHALNLLRKALK